MEGKIVC